MHLLEDALRGAITAGVQMPPHTDRAAVADGHAHGADVELVACSTCADVEGALAPSPTAKGGHSPALSPHACGHDNAPDEETPFATHVEKKRAVQQPTFSSSKEQQQPSAEATSHSHSHGDSHSCGDGSSHGDGHSHGHSHGAEGRSKVGVKGETLLAAIVHVHGHATECTMDEHMPGDVCSSGDTRFVVAALLMEFGVGVHSVIIGALSGRVQI